MTTEAYLILPRQRDIHLIPQYIRIIETQTWFTGQGKLKLTIHHSFLLTFQELRNVARLKTVLNTYVYTNLMTRSTVLQVYIFTLESSVWIRKGQAGLWLETYIPVNYYQVRGEEADLGENMMIHIRTNGFYMAVGHLFLDGWNLTCITT